MTGGRACVRRWTRSAVALAGITFAVPGLAVPAAAQEPMPLPRLTGPIEIDGNLSDAAWQAVAPLELTVHAPRFGVPPTEQTTIRVAYDNDAIYLGAWMYDSDPDAIKVHSVARDVDNGGDFLNLVIDAYNDNQNAVVFATTPSGNRLDFQLQNDAEGPNAGSPSWDAFWDVAVSRDDRGWFAEMRVPFSSLRFEQDGDRVVMGLSVNRLIGRKNERQTFPAIAPDWALAPFKPSQARDVSFDGIRPQRPIFITPYAAARHSTNTALDADLTGYERNDDLDVDAGGDLKYALTNNLNLDLTVNTDFAEVEVDDARVNLTRFSLFFPERRQFFLEREGIFDFGVADLDRPFYSRRIGLTPEGEPVPILAGGRINGRVAGLDLGLLSMQTNDASGQPAENTGVMRLRTNLGSRDSYLGMLGTSRVGGGEHNVLLGGDVELNVGGGNDYLTGEILQTFDSRPDSAEGVLPRGRGRLRLERRSRRGLGFGVGGGVTGAAYRPALGFVLRTGVWDASAEAAYGILTDRAGLRQISPSLSGSVIGTNGARNVETWDVTAGVELDFDSGALLTADVTTTHEDLATGFFLDDEVEVPAGDYRFTRAVLALTAAQSWSSGTGFRAEIGEFFDGRITSFEVSPFWGISPYVRITGAYRIDRLTFDDRAQTFTAHVFRLRPAISLDAKLSSVFTIQYNSAADVATLNARLRYNFAEGNDLWVVYGHVANTDINAVSPVLPRTDATALTVKFTYTFRE
ncbi:MAG TPA: DUF5916 domain-containing protein [Gemmatimonadota bacterium]|nr:DUF5916 domain-containing protein [Gemmatimonadota bacterium]